MKEIFFSAEIYSKMFSSEMIFNFIVQMMYVKPSTKIPHFDLDVEESWPPFAIQIFLIPAKKHGRIDQVSETSNFLEPKQWINN
jgi:hypothetical protein